jgi:hypothetical protein
MKRLACAMALVVLGAVLPVVAQAPDICEVPEYLKHAEGKLARVAIMAKERKLDILVVGTGSSMLGGQEGAKTAYPARLEAALASRLPGVAVTVRTDVKSRRTTADMAKALSSLPHDARPGLVIWQTGTVDAMRGIDPDDFRHALDKAVKKLQAAEVDVVLMNMQYSPRTEPMITVGPYVDSMRWVAQQHDVPLFDRAAVMKHWSDNGVFDFSGSDRSQTAERVHDCIGKLLAETILDAAGLEKTQKDSR